MRIGRRPERRYLVEGAVVSRVADAEEGFGHHHFPSSGREEQQPVACRSAAVPGLLAKPHVTAVALATERVRRYPQERRPGGWVGVAGVGAWRRALMCASWLLLWLRSRLVKGESLAASSKACRRYSH